MKAINVLSTFNGMGCIWYALDRVGIKVNKRYSCEIDKYANQGNDAAYPDTIQLNDVSRWKEWDIDWSSIDLFVGGSPCQGFSFAGKQLAFDDPRSKLFFEFVAIWNHIKKHNPDAKFLLENVQMKKNELRIISEYMGVFPVNINSNLVSAQNRNRWYWSNIRTKDVGLFEEIYTDVLEPKDKGIFLKDVLEPESEVDEKYFMSKNTVKNMMKNFRFSPHEDLNKKAYSITTHPQRSNSNFIKIDKQGNEKADQNKAGCLTAAGNSGGNHSDMDLILYGALKFGRTDEAKQIRKQKLKKGKDYCPFSKKEIVGIDYEKMGAILTGTNKDNLLSDGVRIRRLTPRECGKLQTFTDKELDVLLNAGISDTQLYKMFGNGWTVDAIAHILSFYSITQSQA